MMRRGKVERSIFIIVVFLNSYVDMINKISQDEQDEALILFILKNLVNPVYNSLQQIHTDNAGNPVRSSNHAARGTEQSGPSTHSRSNNPHPLQAPLAHHSFPSRLKHERCTGPASSARRAKAALEIFSIEEVINIPKEAQLPALATQRQRITRAEIGLRESLESITTTRKRPRIEDRADVIARRREIEIDQHATTNMLCGH